jgi:tetratricopeptide (TPR) repeat protein
MDCSRVKAEGTIERYLLGALDDTEREAFEDHLIACAACADELAGLVALQGELARSREQIVAEAAAQPRPSRRTWLLAVAAGLLVVAAGLVMWSRLQPPPTTDEPLIVAELGPLVHPEPDRSIETELDELARFQPPPYTPMRLRGSEDAAARRFREAMGLYAAGDWNGALPGLRAAAALDPEAPHIAFYLGACELLAGETSEAIAALERTAALGDTPFLEEARYLLAKAQLRAGDVDAARGELVKVVALDGDRMEEAQGLLDRLDALEGHSR